MLLCLLPPDAPSNPQQTPKAAHLQCELLAPANPPANPTKPPSSTPTLEKAAHLQCELLPGRKGLEPQDAQAVGGGDLVIVSGVGKGQGQHTLRGGSVRGGGGGGEGGGND